MNSQATTKSYLTVNKKLNMCKRMVTVCLMCRCETMTLNTCGEWKEDTNRNVFGSGWMKTHVDRNKYNLINSLRIVVCTRCMDTSMVVKQPEFDSKNKKAIDDLVTEIKGSLNGITNLRVKFPGYVIFS